MKNYSTMIRKNLKGRSRIANMHMMSLKMIADARFFYLTNKTFYFGRSGVAPHNTLFSCTLNNLTVNVFAYP
jgi:hypothetical protein